MQDVPAQRHLGTSNAEHLLYRHDLLEAYRLEEREKALTEKDPRKILSEEEKKAARLYLSSPNLVARTQADIGKAGVIGEATNRMLLYLVYTSRKRDNPLHAISLGSSGNGKTPNWRKFATCAFL